MTGRQFIRQVRRGDQVEPRRRPRVCIVAMKNPAKPHVVWEVSPSLAKRWIEIIREHGFKPLFIVRVKRWH